MSLFVSGRVEQGNQSCKYPPLPICMLHCVRLICALASSLFMCDSCQLLLLPEEPVFHFWNCLEIPGFSRWFGEGVGGVEMNVWLVC